MIRGLGLVLVLAACEGVAPTYSSIASTTYIQAPHPAPPLERRCTACHGDSAALRQDDLAASALLPSHGFLAADSLVADWRPGEGHCALEVGVAEPVAVIPSSGREFLRPGLGCTACWTPEPMDEGAKLLRDAALANAAQRSEAPASHERFTGVRSGDCTVCHGLEGFGSPRARSFLR